jgi:hypothetical protein
MSSPSKKGSESGSKSKKTATSLDLTTARQMLPLVRSIVNDIVANKRKVADLSNEQHQLEVERRNLTWESRQRRYAVTDEIQQAERNLTTAVGELNQLGLALVDGEAGAVDFPTRINGRPAAFTWEPGEENLRYWRYAEEEQRRPIPADWQPGTAMKSRAGA